jgi:signal peptidase II
MIRRWMTGVALAAVVATTIGCDQVSKRLATKHLLGAPARSYFGDTLRLVYAQNTGAFLSLGSSLPAGMKTALFSFGTAMVLAACVVVIVRHRSVTLPVLGLALVVAGGLSNLADRVARGAVIDFVNVGIGPLRTGIFNVADMTIVAGVALILLGSRRERIVEDGSGA